MKRVLAILLCLVMVMGFFPATALAEESPAPEDEALTETKDTEAPSLEEAVAPAFEEEAAEPLQAEEPAEPALETDDAPADAADGTVYRHWDDATGTLTFDNEPKEGTAITALNSSTLLGGVAQKADVKKIVFACDVPVSDANCLFYNFTGLTAIEGLGYLDISGLTEMKYTFSGCSGLTSLDLSGLDTSSVTKMDATFSFCVGLTSLNTSGLVTSNVTEMVGTFLYCSSLTELDVSGFNTQKVEDMSMMFAGCSGLTELDVSGFDTANVTSLSGMFLECTALRSLDVSGFKTGFVTDMGGVFYNCSSLTSLDVSGFNTANAEKMNGLFFGCSGLTKLDVSGFKTEKVTDMRGIFYGCSGLTTVDISGFITEKATTMELLFDGCTGLKQLKVGANFGAACESGQEAKFPVDMVELVSGEAMPAGSIIPQNVNSKRTYVVDLPTYTVTYEANGAVEGVPEAQTKTHGVDLVLSDMVPEYFPGAIWPTRVELIDYDSYNKPYGTVLGTETVTVHDFKEWNTSIDGKGTSYNPGDVYSIDEDVTLYAQWNHGVQTFPVELPTPTRYGHVFKGWGTSPDATEGFTGTYTPSGDVTLYALWEPLFTYTVSYSALNSYEVPEAQTKIPSYNLLLSDTIPYHVPDARLYTVTLETEGGDITPNTSALVAEEMTTYSFTEWNTSPDGSGTSYHPGEYYCVEDDVILHAQWEKSIETMSVELPTPTREGFTFKGWGLSPDDTEGITGSYMPTEDVTLYALWEAEVCEHIDADGDLFCDECGERLGVVVTVTSASGSLNGGTVANVSGGGKLYYGESTTLNAPAVSGYNFAGWYRDGTLFSGSAQVSFTATEAETADVAFIALYTPQPGAKHRLTVNGSYFTISGFSSEQAGSFTDLLDADSAVTVTFTGDEEFLYWVNGSKKVMSTSKSYTLRMVADTEMTAVYARAQNQPNKAYVVYLTSTSNGQVLKMGYFSDTDPIEEPKPDPIRIGYIFTGWTLSEDEIHAKMATENYIKVYPTYAPSGATYRVTIENNVGADPFVSDPINAGEEYMAHADQSLGTFSYWVLNGKIVSYNDVVVIRAMEDVTVTAVYNEDVTRVPVMTLTDVFQTQNGGKTTITFSSLRAVTEDYTVERVGILYSASAELEGKTLEELRALMVEESEMNRIMTESKDRNAVFNINLTATRPVHVYGRAYMILMKDGVSYTFYSDEILDLVYAP